MEFICKPCFGKFFWKQRSDECPFCPFCGSGNVAWVDDNGVMHGAMK